MLADPRLSWKAKGILAYLVGHPDNWVVQVDDLVKKSTTGRDAVYAALKELKENGYAKLEVLREGGKFASKQWFVADFPYQENPDQENPYTGNPHLSKNDRLRTTKKRKNCGDLRATADPSSSNGFFEDENPASPFILKCVDKLDEYIKKVLKIKRRINRPSWAKEMVLLLRDLEGNKSRLKRVVSIYTNETIDHNEFTPVATDARSFRRKFSQIERWSKPHFDGEFVESITEKKLANGETEVTFQYGHIDD